jgi:hypothetical protein
LHGRRAFTRGAPRHLYRVNVLDEDRRWWASLRAAWRVRRPEFFRAELPILLIPALLVAATPASLLSLAFLEGVLLFFLLFNVGDMVNCWFDKDIDLHRKTHLSEAISRLGSRSLLLQAWRCTSGSPSTVRGSVVLVSLGPCSARATQHRPCG